MSDIKVRTIFIFKEYLSDYFKKQSLKVKEKIILTFWLIEQIEHVPEEFLKHLEGTDDLYEIKIKQGGNSFRILCFFNKGRFIVIGNGFQKKSQKTPKNEISKAYKIREEYEKEK